MLWFSLAASAISTALILLVIGVPLARIVGLRGFASVAIAPAFAMTVICGASVVLPWVRVPWGPLGVLAVAVCVAGVLIAARWATRRWRPVHTVSPRASRDVGLTAGLVVAGALTAARVVTVIQEPTRISQTFDNVFHLNAVRWVLDTGSASALEIGYMTNPAGPPTFYPSGWHALVALTAQLVHSEVPVAINGAVVAITSIVWPLGIVFLTRTLFGRSPALSIATGIVAAAVPLPLLLMDYGVLYPFQLGIALLPSALAMSAHVLGTSASSDGIGRLWWTISLAGVMPGLALVHPGALMAWLALSAPMALVFVVMQWRRHRSRGRRIKLAVGTTVYLVLAAAMVFALRPPAGARGWQPEMSLNDAFVRVLTAHTWYPYAPIAVALAAAVGVVCVLIRRTPAGLCALGMWTVACILFIVVAAVPFPIRDLFTAPWYNNIPRIAALVYVTIVPLAAYGLAVIWSRVARSLRHRGARRATVGVAAAVAVIAVTQIGPFSAMPQAQRVASASYALTPDSPS